MKHYLPRVSLFCITAWALTIALFPVAAFAQTTTPTPTSTPTPSPTITSEDQVTLSIWVIILAALVVIAAMIYLSLTAARFYDALTRVSKTTGSLAPHTEVSGIATAFGVNPATASGLSIKGPAAINVGEPSTFSLIRADGTPGPPARWAVLPPDRADLSVSSGQSVVVSAKSEGDFELTATWDDTAAGTPTTSVVRTNVLARKAAEKPPSIPLIARGFITVILVPLLLAITGVLALTDRLSSAAAAVLSGALGFLFGRQGASSGDQPSQGSNT